MYRQSLSKSHGESGIRITKNRCFSNRRYTIRSSGKNVHRDEYVWTSTVSITLSYVSVGSFHALSGDRERRGFPRTRFTVGPRVVSSPSIGRYWRPFYHPADVSKVFGKYENYAVRVHYSVSRNVQKRCFAQILAYTRSSLNLNDFTLRNGSLISYQVLCSSLLFINNYR